MHPSWHEEATANWAKKSYYLLLELATCAGYATLLETRHKSGSQRSFPAHFTQVEGGGGANTAIRFTTSNECLSFLLFFKK